ncbi:MULTISPECIES: ATP phosphoribosyltransferase [Aminobacterium]|uniref:ATP phosphoribosyltransferase n=1 Tax=Aminobacterium colombiense (strain DSM 12261 / ALA-1) TaxID=572547 RepID=D5EE35_AMICL|nr:MULTISPECIES: ATP phosphoribosyltransferase [Aminobacterium]MDD2378671.1 ATP phosphoribosyltransferase [Aminobacterium colombiense]ADE56817.1 ATP phosphoribosyltransferase [Aminobacterium colombiense DSM 12261]MDD3767688.1 ATP phosphoribosyltransferase [Aminobacterium colombiense]MDD4264973.1 ATP phosphoribosyltransferase [Aminobacterium colombiense]MDD4585464.1 ATP phosphoribosyltransferase [Aminobacterium colombiense]
MLTLALPTGRVMKEAIDLCDNMGLPTAELRKAGRRLVVQENNYRYILAKPTDVPLYVSYGVADLALVGNDVLQESAIDLVELADTERGKCRIVVAGPEELRSIFTGHPSELMWLKIATKYPRIADIYFSSLGVQVEIIHLHGSIELAPALGMAHCILDIVQTGTTLQANKLVVLQEVAKVSLRLVASRQSTSLRWPQMSELLQRIGRQKGVVKDVH